ncbi:MAG: hypothetical protein HYY24_27810 [Verrucomicrobia bacterium]|nr:hypothetical protein [Verrucomicrobiota bacterium]
MNLFRAIFKKIAAELRVQRIGRRALREVHFAKYKVAPQRGDRNVAERLLRRFPGSFETSAFSLTTSH